MILLDELKNKPPMTNEDMLKGNHFADCGTKDLLMLWDGLRNFYSNGYIADDSPLKPFQNIYLQEYEYGLGLIAMEKDLLRIMAVRYSIMIDIDTSCCGCVNSSGIYPIRLDCYDCSRCYSDLYRERKNEI